MRRRKRQILCSSLMLLLGVLGAAMRLLLEDVGLDWKGLIPAGHPLGIALGILTAAALLLALFSAWRIGKLESYEDSFPCSFAGSLGHLLAAAGILLTMFSGQSGMQGRLNMVWKVLGFASVPCLAAAGWLRLRGKQPFFLLHLCPAAFLMLHTVNQYQSWSSDPQVLNYIFPLLGMVCMSFYAFYHSAFDVGLLWRRRLSFFSMASILLGILALPGCVYPWLYLGVALWALLDHPVSRIIEKEAGE